ncbi:MAG: transglycosylase SLT domain-containing protein [Methylobacter sp.]
MRLLPLVLNMLVGACLLTNATDTLAAYGSSKTSKNNHHRGQGLRTRDKGQDKNKKSAGPGDLWERIRAGMQIPLPSQEQVQLEKSPATEIDKPSQITSGQFAELNSIIAKATIAGSAPSISEKTNPQQQDTEKNSRLPHTTFAPVHNYTSLGHRLKLNAGSSGVNIGHTRFKQEFAEKHNNLTKPSSGQTRIRSVIGFHPELGKHNLKTPLDSVANAVPPGAGLNVANNNDKKTLLRQRCVEHTEQKLANQEQQIQSLDQQNGLKAQCGATQASKYERVNKFIAWYKERPAYLHQVAERAKPYLYHIVEGLNKKKLPLELALLPIVESAYQPTAQSPKSAAGLWQFIPSTGNDFDLGQSQHYDERLDITASTEAAIRFLSRLKQHFHGDWLLALAAYNCGQGAVDEAINRNRAEGLPSDFWSLSLPEETQDYVPRLLALSSIFAKPADHGVKLVPISNEPYFVKVKIDHSTDIKNLAGKNLATVAQLANLSYEKFTLLNPGFISPTLATDGPFTFLMPVANADRLHQGLSSLTRVVTDIQKTEKSLAAEISAITNSRQTKYATPFLSLDMRENETAPRIASDSSVSTM